MIPVGLSFWKLSLFLLLSALLVVLLPNATASAQQEQITTGVVVNVETNPSGGLSAFIISNEDGEQLRFQVSSDTQFGLEDEVGTRWTAVLSDSPQEAARRMQRHLSDFAPVTVTTGASSQVANTVTEAEPTNLETNLAWVGATFGITWVGFFAYFLWVSKRQTDLQSEIKRLKTKIETSEIHAE